MNNLDRIKQLRAQDYGVAGLSTTDVDWLIAEVERLTAERGRYKAWHDEVAARETVCVVDYEYPGDAKWLGGTKYGDSLIVRPKPLKENE